MSQPTNQTQPETIPAQDSVIAELRSEIEKLKAVQPVSAQKPKRSSSTPKGVRLILYWIAFCAIPFIGIWLMVRDAEYKWKHFFLSLLTFFLISCSLSVIFYYAKPILTPSVVRSTGQNNSGVAPVQIDTPNLAPTQAAPAILIEFVKIPEGYGYGIVQATGAVFSSPGGKIIYKFQEDAAVTWLAMKNDCQWFLASPGPWLHGNNVQQDYWVHVRDIESFYSTELEVKQAFAWGFIRNNVRPTC